MQFNNPNFQPNKQAYNQTYKQIVEKSMNKMKKPDSNNWWFFGWVWLWVQLLWVPF